MTVVGSFPCWSIGHLEWKPTVYPINQENSQAGFANYDPFKGMDLEEADSKACNGEALWRGAWNGRSIVLPGGMGQ